MSRPEKGDDFTRNRFSWLDQVLADEEISKAAFAVAYALASHINRKSGLAWPSQSTLAKQVSLSDRQVRKLVEQLVERGHLFIAKRHTRHTPNYYRLAFLDRNASSTLDDSRPEPEVHPVTGTEVPLFPELDRNFCASRSELLSIQGGTTVPHNPLSEPIEEPLESLPRKTAVEKEFNTFWKTYPKKADEADARKAFAKARKKASAELILEGARKYADERQGQDSQYTRGAARWLNAEAWNNASVARSQHQPAKPDIVQLMLQTGFDKED